MKKRYTVAYGWSFDMVVDIDHSICTEDKLNEINSFWSSADWRLEQAKGDITKAVLKMLALTAFRMTISEFDPVGVLRRGEEEGWPKLDGSYGITLVSLDDFELDEDEITIKSEDV